MKSKRLPMKKILLFFVFLFISSFAFSQVTIVYYEFEYNDETNLFDCKMNVEDGSAISAADRLQLGAQYSIIVETGKTVAIAESYLPIYNNETYTGTVPMNWSIGNIEVNPAELPGYDIIGIVPDIGGEPAHYNDLSCCNSITLFSLSVTGGDICELSIRLFESDFDPTSLPSGINFINSMMIGNTDDIYWGNSNTNSLWDDVDITIPNADICEGDCVTLVPELNCVFPGLTYSWGTGETTETITVCPEVSENYYIYLSGPFGEGVEVGVYVNVDKGIYGDGDLDTDLCVGVPVYYFPEYGIWSSSDENIVTVTNDGYVVPISVGSATISHTTDAGNCLDEVVVTVQSPESPLIIGEDEICENETTQLSPSAGVIWESGNPAIATVDNTGLVTGTGFGTTVFTYTTEEGCVSEVSPPVSVLIIPEPIITGLDTICTNQSTTLMPNAGVTWESSDISIATIDNSGNVTGVSKGSVRFYFTDMATGCTSMESEPVTILPSPYVQLSTDSVCVGDILYADATHNSLEGTWLITVISGNPNPANINELGLMETTASAVISVQYLNENGCLSENSALLTILPQPTPVVSSNSPLCIGENILLTATSPPGANYSYQWTGPNGFSSNQMNVTIPNAEMNQSGVYTLVASENGCVSQEFNVDVIVADCDPCADAESTGEWVKVPASLENFPDLSSFEVGGALVSGRELEDIIYYDYDNEMRLIFNNGEGYFEEEVVLFNHIYTGGEFTFDIVDIDQDGLNDIVTYQLEPPTGPEPNSVTITIFKNFDNFSFEKSLQIVEENGIGYFYYNRMYRDLDDQGYLDIIPLEGTVYFTDNWVEGSYQFPENILSLIIDDFDEDGLLDILGLDNQLFINNGDRTFSFSMLDGDWPITSQGLYDSGTGLFNNGYLSLVITSGENPSVEICWDPGIFNSQSYFYANINSSSAENGIITTPEGFYIYETPLTCENSSEFESIFDFIPEEDGKIDFTGNGFSDFVTVENGNIFVWINPNALPKLRGTAFIDNNGDGILNENDSPLRNVLISIEPGNLSVLTDDNGSYQFAVPEGTYTLTAKVNEGEWIMDQLTIENVDVEEPCNLGFDFGFVPDLTAIPMVNLSMVNTIARCDFEVKFTITVENTGTEPLESILQFDFDDKTSFFSTEIVGASVIGNKVTADIGPLAPFQPQKYEIKVKMPSGSSVLPMLDFKSTLLNEMGENIAEYGYSEQLRCSYDPNDKRTFPDREGEDNLTLMDEALEYTIRFQNNGNDTAYNVKIIDPLDGNIDPSSIRVVGSSHNVETCIEGTDLIFLFEEIYLVDSTTNYPGSQGYVTYKCNTKEGVAEYTIVNNTADIYFDTNLPISTNQTINTLVSKLCTDESTVIDMYICDGEEYMGHSESGTYTESFELLYGCDSLVTINLTVQGITYTQQDVEVCEAGTIYLGTKEYFIEGSTTILDTIVNDQGCVSSILKFEVTVVPDLIDIVGGLAFCQDEVGSISPELDGMWSSDDETVILIDDQGNITTVNPGEATLQYTDNETGCIDELSIVVHPDPILSNDGSGEICINETNQLTSDIEGTWFSSDSEVATVTSDGMILGKDAGTVSVIFTSSISGCSKSIEIIVLPSTDSNCTVSTNDLSSELIKIYPNPASESVFIESIESWNNIKLVNAQGQVLLNDLGEYQTKKQIDLNAISSGLYFLLIERDSGVVMRRFVVD